MDDNVQTEGGLHSDSTLDAHRPPSERFASEQNDQQKEAEFAYDASSCGSVLFSKAHGLAVSGGTFTNITNNTHTVSTAIPDFRRIPLGDIYVQDEIGVVKTSSIVGHLRHRCFARRVYSARVEGRQSDVTVAIYQGDDVEKKWQEDLVLYTHLRHPGFVQLWGLTTTSGIHAAIFHDDLIPFKHFLDLHRNSPVVIPYIYAYVAAEYEKSQDYFDLFFEGPKMYHLWCTLWIRASTGRLCVDPVQCQSSQPFAFLGVKVNRPALTSVTEFTAVKSLTLDHYHQICGLGLRRFRLISGFPSVTVDLGSVICWPSCPQSRNSVQIASVPGVRIHPNAWRTERDAVRDVMENGWTRFHSSDVLGVFGLSLRFDTLAVWLSQANHMFTRLHITSKLHDYSKFDSTPRDIRVSLNVLPDTVDGIDFCISINPPEECPAGYLFLCPPKELQIGPSSYRWPACAAYWTRDPSGIERFSTEEAAQLGFPAIALKTNLLAYSWDSSVYAGLRKFHRGKGFDPDSEDVARHLGYPLYQLTGEVDAPFACVTDKTLDFWADDEDRDLGFADREPEELRNLPDANNVLGDEPHEENSHPESNKQTPSAKHRESHTHEITTSDEGGFALSTSNEDLHVVSPAFNFTISVQLALILLACLADALFNGVSE